MLSLLTALILSVPAAFAEERTLDLPSGRQSVLWLEEVDPAARWIVLLPGSGCGLYDVNGSHAIADLRENSIYNLLVINKAGVPSSGPCRWTEFNEGSVRSERIKDVQAAIDEVLPKSAEVLLIGESEGGYIAPDIGLSQPRVKSIIMLSGGTRSWIEEEIMLAPPPKREALKKFFFEEVIPFPNQPKFYNGWPYAHLQSYHTRQTYFTLLGIDVPVLALIGSHDRALWVHGNRKDLEKVARLNSKVEFHLMEGADHGLNCDGEATGDCTAESVRDEVCSKLLEFSNRH